MKIFLNNYTELGNFETSTVKAMLVHGYIYHPEHRYVVDVAPTELTDPSYARAELTNKQRLTDSTAGRITLVADNPNFGFVDNESVNGFVIFKEVTNDLDSKLLFYWPLPEELLEGNIAYEINFDPAGILKITTY